MQRSVMSGVGQSSAYEQGDNSSVLGTFGGSRAGGEQMDEEPLPQSANQPVNHTPQKIDDYYITSNVNDLNPERPTIQNGESYWENYMKKVEKKPGGPDPATSIVSFYKMLFNRDASDLNLDMEQVLENYKRKVAALRPAEGFLTNIDKNSVDELARNVSSIPDSQQYDLVQRTEKLYMRLMIEYNQELHRAHSIGLFRKQHNPSGSSQASEQQTQPVSHFDSGNHIPPQTPTV